MWKRDISEGSKSPADDLNVKSRDEEKVSFSNNTTFEVFWLRLELYSVPVRLPVVYKAMLSMYSAA